MVTGAAVGFDVVGLGVVGGDVGVRVDGIDVVGVPVGAVGVQVGDAVGHVEREKH
jgi:hypothetical protein